MAKKFILSVSLILLALCLSAFSLVLFYSKSANAYNDFFRALIPNSIVAIISALIGFWMHSFAGREESLEIKTLSSLKNLGIVRIWSERGNLGEEDYDYVGYCRSVIRRARPGAQIRLLSTAGGGIALAETLGEMEPAFRDPLRNGCSFQVILVHPGSKQVSIKQNAEDSSGIYGDPRDEGYLAGKIRDKLRRLENWQSQAERDPEIRAWPGAISVRCVEEIPIVNLVDNGSEALMALQVINRKGIDSPVFLLSKEGTLYKYLQSYFDFLYREMSIDGKEAATAYDKKEEGGRNPLTPNGD